MSTHQTTAKRIANALLAAVLAIGLMVPTFALTSQNAYAAEITLESGGAIPSSATDWYDADGHNINVKSTQSGRTYRIYQVFKGDYANDALTNIAWGASVGTNGDAVVSALKNDTTIGSAFKNVGLQSPNDGSTAITADAQAQAVAAVLANYAEADNAVELAAFAKAVYSVIGSSGDYVVPTGGSSKDAAGYYTWGVQKVHDGYYLASDETAATSTSVVSRNMLEVTNLPTVDMYAKDDSSVPKATKKATSFTSVGSGTNGADVTTSLDNASAVDAKVGDSVTFTITVTTPDTTGYSAYKLIANDLLGKGLTFGSISSVTVTTPATTTTPNPTATPMTAVDGDESGTSIPDGEYAVSYYTLSTDDDANPDDLTDYVSTNSTTPKGYARIAFDLGNMKNYATGSTITITYTATINDDIRASSEAKKTTNKVVLEYSNDPDDSDSTKTDGDPGGGGSVVNIDTAGFVIYKTDGSSRLSGAGFSITGNGLSTVLYRKPTYTATLLEAGHTPDANDYYKQTDGTFETCYDTVSGNYVDPNDTSTGSHGSMLKEPTEYTTTDNTTYTKVAVGTGTHYKLTDSSNNVTYVTKGSYNTTTYPTSTYTIESEYARYLRSETEDFQTSPTTASVNLVSDSNGALIVEGLSAGSYVIKETQNPSGYQLLDYDINLTVVYNTSTGKYTYTFTNATTGATLQQGTSGTTGLPSITVVNENKGSLPATGGIGTTIFYIVGGVLVVGALVFLVTRRRMKAERE